ncbi:MAG TPA: hypothetical protein VHP14_06190, partial [Anaerolineales bacterium]|nr:hypothetical protein [Anaerolineales bacterium]
MNNKTLVVGLIIISLLIISLIARNGDIAWMILPFLAYLGMGILQSPSLETLRFSAERKLEQIRSNGSASVHVNLVIQNQASETVHLFVNDTVPVGTKISTGELKRQVSLQSGESTELSYTFTAARGDFSWTSIHAVVSDPLGLIETEIWLPASATLQVRPSIKKFKAIPLRPRSTVHSPGSIPARLGGNGTSRVTSVITLFSDFL